MNLTRQLQAIQIQYLEKLPQTLTQIESLAHRLPKSDPGDENWQQLGQLLHKLSGSAGTFGLPALSAQAAKLHRQFEAALLVDGDSYARECHLFISEIETLDTFAELDGIPAKPSADAQDEGSSNNNRPLVSEVWLLEDDADLGSTLISHLQAFNFSARLFTSFTDLIHTFESEQPEVLILDVLLGDEGRSTELLEQSSMLTGASSRLIFISAKDDFTIRLQAASLGAEAFFVKPLDIPRLITRLEQVTARLHAPPERVLIIDDDELLARYYQQLMINANMQVDILHEPDRVIDYLLQNSPDIILMDLQMPDIEGQTLAAVIRQYDQWVGLPIIYLSAEDDPDHQATALNHGADDFLVKPVPDQHLISAVKHKVSRSRQLLELMTKDSLTGLLKHAAIKESIRREWGIAKRKSEIFCVAMLDIDHFKQVNDRFGHAIGDEVIASVATLLRKRLRNTDVLGRYGGEEFVVLMNNCDAVEAKKILENFRQRFQELVFTSEEKQFSATISIGIAEYQPGSDMDADALLINADKAMYTAKETGRNRVIVS
ncbi:diguanylate cyclase [Pseudohongiella acticola]|uniref:diguanylate cyclase n=1 Tax=Pseudohongiella acticola TaxID=1524254 RepID=UPI0009F476EE|nr:diguanylate cyclase [Pseudohongiella acticola]